jgi:hypothetical protein
VKGTVQEMRHLNRLVCWTEKGYYWEPDPRHADIVISTLGVKGGRVSTPLVKEREGAGDDESDPLLDEEEKHLFQSLTMRVGYLSQDRVDLQRAVRELAKGMSSPRQSHMTVLKRVGRYLAAFPRVAQLIPRQSAITTINTFCDTDHAGCVRTRKSTTGVVIKVGDAFVRSICRGQSLIALSSGEAEFYGLVSAASESLGDQSLAEDFGIRLNIRIHMDATAGAAIGSRRGLGRVKHLSTVFLWVQEYVTSGKIRLYKVHTSENPADMLTKAVSGLSIRSVMESLFFEYGVTYSTLAYSTA